MTVEKSQDMSFVVRARSAFEAGYLYDEEYIMLLDVHKKRVSISENEAIIRRGGIQGIKAKEHTERIQSALDSLDSWLETIANRIEAGITVQAAQSLTERPLHSLKVVDPQGNTRQLVSFDIETVMEQENLVEAKSRLGKQRLRSVAAKRHASAD